MSKPIVFVESVDPDEWGAILDRFFGSDEPEPFPQDEEEQEQDETQTNDIL